MAYKNYFENLRLRIYLCSFEKKVLKLFEIILKILLRDSKINKVLKG